MTTNQQRFVAPYGLDNNDKTLVHVADPVNAQDAATKNFASNASNLTSGTLDLARMPTNTTLDQHHITDVYTKTQVDAAIAALSGSGGSGATVSHVSGVTLASGGTTTITGQRVLAVDAAIAGSTFSLDYTTATDYAQQDGTNGTSHSSGVFALSSDAGSNVDTNTKLLIHADGSNGSAEIVDSRGITPFGTHCAYFDGTAYYTVPSSHKLAFGTSQDFTIEAWARRSVSSQMCLFDMRTSNSLNPMMDVVANGAVRAIAGAAVVNSAAGFTNDAWHHVAWSRSSGTSRIFLNGTLLFSFADTYAYVAGKTTIGDEGGGGSKWVGWLDEFRVSKVARYTANFAPHTAPHVRDADTVYLFHFNDGHGSQLIRDDSRSGHEISLASGASISTAQKKFGSSSLYTTGGFNKVAASKYHTDLAIGAEDFTADFQFRPTISNSGFVAVFGDASYTCQIWHSGGNYVLWYSTDGSTWVSGGGITLTSATVDQWSHIAVTRSGTTFYVFVDGTQRYSASVSTNSIIRGNGIVTLGAHPNGSNSVTGYFDEFRFKRGVAEWTTNFTPPTSAHTTDDRTVLLLHFDGTHGDKVTLDSSESSYGTAQISESTIPAFVAPSGLTSAQTRGGHATSMLASTWNGTISASQTSAAGHPLFPQSSEYFCREFWAYIPTGTVSKTLLTQQESSVSHQTHHIRIESDGKLYVYLQTAAGTNSSLFSGGATGWTGNAWNHIAYVREGRGYALYVTGTLVAGPVNASLNPYYATTYWFGIGHNCYNEFSNCYIDSVRITTGKPRYTANFTPGNLTQDDDTALLLEYNGSVGQKWVKELSKNSALIAATNARTVSDGMWIAPGAVSPLLSTAQMKFGSTALSFATGNYIELPSSSFNAGFSMTIDCWVHPTSGSSQRTIIQKRTGNTVQDGFVVYLDAANGLHFAQFGSMWGDYSGGSVPTNTWSHIAVEFHATNFYLYVNGVRVFNGTGYISNGQALSNPSVPLRIGLENSNNNPFTGYIDELRITQGTSRYGNVGSFTLPTSQYGQQYATGPYWVATKPGVSSIDLSQWNAISSMAFSGSTPVGTSLKFLVSFDGYATPLKYWNGSTWVATSYSMTWNSGTGALTTNATSTQLNGVANTYSELQTGMLSLDTSAISSCNIVAILTTSNTANTPTLDALTFIMTEFQMLTPGIDYKVTHKKMSGSQTLTITRLAA